MATKVHWKSSKLKIPVFRRSVRAVDGWKKSETEPMKYSTYAFYLDRIGADLGSEEKWTSYCMRRGNANAILGIAPDGVVDQVMRHDPMTGCMQNAYLNSRVEFNTQDAFLERDPSADGLTRAFTHMSIRCNPDVPKEIPREELEKLEPDPATIDLEDKVKKMRRKIRHQYRLINLAPKDLKDEYHRLQKDLKNVKKAFKEDMSKAYRIAYRNRLHDEELERQINGTVIGKRVEPTIRHQLKERTQLQTILCDLTVDLKPTEITNRKVRAIDLMVQLASRREVRQPQLSSSCDTETQTTLQTIEEPLPKEEIPLKLQESQCIYCVGDEKLPYQTRMRTFSKPYNMRVHVERYHLKHEKDKSKFTCHHPQCKSRGDFLKNLDHFKNHVLVEHGIKLRK
ncbi:hypothetical protein TrVFT333_006460 [Trichoderma virens FT-333]|nr:hypothetical protein TrVFT333_006460 [Trichoderma virens FT-333]